MLAPTNYKVNQIRNLLAKVKINFEWFSKNCSSSSGLMLSSDNSIPKACATAKACSFSKKHAHLRQRHVNTSKKEAKYAQRTPLKEDQIEKAATLQPSFQVPYAAKVLTHLGRIPQDLIWRRTALIQDLAGHGSAEDFLELQLLCPAKHT